jgi:hypothetical protein
VIRACRWFLLVSLVVVFAGTIPPGRASAEDLHFYIGQSIAADDAMFIREGIRLGQDYVQEALGAEIETPTIVNAVPAAPRTGADLVGLSTSHSLVVFTGSDGWEETAPFDRVHVVVHEYMHVVQQELGGDRFGAPLWLDEGIAEYVGFQTVIEAGLVADQDVEDYNALQVLFDDPLPPLDELERPVDFQSQSASVYGLSYLAVKQLIGDRPDAIRRYYERLDSGANWRAAFQSAFRTNPRTFYQEFEAARLDLSAPFGFPDAFSPIDDAEFPADVSLEAAPESIVRGDQLLVLADSAAGVRCSLTVATRTGRELLTQPTFADATGSLFWLWTVPAESRRANVTASISCGGEAVTSPLTIE